MPAPAPSLELYQRIRAGLIVQGTTLKAWCRANGYDIVNARAAVIGTWNGPKGQALRARLCKAAGVAGDRR